MRGTFFDILKEAVELFQGCSRRVRVIKDISRNEQCVSFLQTDLFQQPIKKTLMLVTSFEIMKCMPYMPVSSVKETHDASLQIWSYLRWLTPFIEAKSVYISLLMVQISCLAPKDAE